MPETGVRSFRERRLMEAGFGRTGRGGGAAGRTAGAAAVVADEDMPPSNHSSRCGGSGETHNQGLLRGSPHDARTPPVDKMEA